MQKIDYGDINKFLVSSGLILIIIAILIPYLYLKEDFGLYIENDMIEKFQKPVQELILDKQKTVIIIKKIIPWASFGFLILGIISSIIGLVRWLKRQKKIDEKFDKEIVKLNFEINSLTPEEEKEKAKNEVFEIELEEKAPSIITSSASNYAKYMAIEKEIISVFKNYNSANFKILSQQKLGNKFNVDLLLRARSKKFSDIIVEVKYFSKFISQMIIRRTLDQLNTYISYYKSGTDRQVIPVLLIVYNEKTVNTGNLSHTDNVITRYSEGITNLNGLKVQFIKEEKIKDFDVRKILK